MSDALSLVRDRSEPVMFQPGLNSEDALAQYWLRQTTLRLRREVAWLWHERASQADARNGYPDATAAIADQADHADRLPPFSDPTLSALDLTRYAQDKRAFFAHDVTARHLSDLIAKAPPADNDAPRGSFGWVVRSLALTSSECFVLALALLPAVDSAAGSVIATCQNDGTRMDATLALAQRLWDQPDDMIHLMDPAHSLLRVGLLRTPVAASANLWHAPLQVAGLLARELIFPGRPLPRALRSIEPQDADVDSLAGVVPALSSTGGDALHIITVVAPHEAPLDRLAGACAQGLGMACVQPDAMLGREHIAELLTLSWLRGVALYLPIHRVVDAGAHEPKFELPLPGLPHTVILGSHDRADMKWLPAGTPPPIEIPPLDFAQRLRRWQQLLPPGIAQDDLAELARRFRYEHTAIERVAAVLPPSAHAPVLADLLRAAQRDLDPGTLAQKVTPRFALNELMLPPAQSRQMAEIITALRNLTRTHHHWGTAKVWNEAGLAVLFAGPPGTGKTMAAEAIAAEMALPMYRIDLSQVVNKYVGETEKNLRRLFDQTESTDAILFFDEADALFGKRTEVKDAHDRYANLEISYLLERMERFKGLAILATNRKKDLDEAFLRRLRYVVQFPMPGVSERKRIWRAVIPPEVDGSALDFDFLAQRFPLAGGHIRAVVFHACLQSAAADAPKVLSMPALIRSLRREYDKLERAISLDQFGDYAGLVESERSLP